MKKNKNLAIVVTIAALGFAAAGCNIFNPEIDKWWVGPEEGAGGGDTGTGKLVKYNGPLVEDYTITFDSNGGDYIDLVDGTLNAREDPPDQDIKPGDKVMEPGLVTGPSGKKYIRGWYQDKNGNGDYDSGEEWDFANDTPTGNTRLIARWENTGVEVKFELNEQSTGISKDMTTYYNPSDPTSGLPLKEYVAAGNILSVPKHFGLANGSPKSSTYVFDGWYEEAACTTKWNFDLPVSGTGTKILYAKWKPSVGAKFDVTFDSGGAITTPPGRQVEAGQTLVEPNALRKTDYRFDGWYKDGGNTKYNFGDPVNSDTHLVAKWTLIPYSHTWFINNGYHAVIPLSTDDFVKPYYPVQFAKDDGGDETLDPDDGGPEWEDNAATIADVTYVVKQDPKALVLIKGYGKDDAVIKQREESTRAGFYQDNSSVNPDQIVKFTDYNTGAGVIANDGGSADEVRVYIYARY